MPESKANTEPAQPPLTFRKMKDSLQCCALFNVADREASALVHTIKVNAESFVKAHLGDCSYHNLMFWHRTAIVVQL